MAQVAATIVKLHALQVIEKGLFPWHVEGELTVESLTGNKYTYAGRWKGITLAKPQLFTGYCEPPGVGSFLRDVESLLSHFYTKDEARYPQDEDERRTALNRWWLKIQMQAKLYSTAVKEYATLCV